MKNWEKYEKEIKELGLGLGGFTITKSGEVDKCANISCFKCKFCETNETCRATVVKWLFEDYEEPKPKLTMEERAIVKSIISTAFIARDEDGTLCIYNSKVGKDETSWYSEDKAMVIDAKLFPFITWDSGKAWSIEELKELEVEE